jgi:hypothetical protein
MRRLGRELAMDGSKLLQEVGRLDLGGVVADEDRAKPGRRLDHPVNVALAERSVHREDEEVQRQVDIHLAVLDEHRPLAGVAVDDGRLSLRRRRPISDWCDC